MALFVAVLPQLPAQAQMANTQTPENWRDSLSVLNSQIKLSAWNTDLHLRKAAVNLELQQWQYAIDEYGLILQHEAQNPAALFYRAYANTHLRRYDMARRDYEELLQIFPRHAEARLSLAYVLQLMGRKTDALDHLNTLVEQNPDSAVAYASRAALEREMKQYEASLYDWQQAINRDPKNIGYLASKVDLLVSLNRRKEALREFEAASRRCIPQGVINKLKHEF